MAKWHDDNPDKWREHITLCAVNQNFAVDEYRLLEAERAGLIRRYISWDLTEAGEKRLEEVTAEIRTANDAEE